MRFFETHAHLRDSAFDSDRGDAVSRAEDSGVALFTEIACEAADWENALQFCAGYEGTIFCALGIHPHNCNELDSGNIAKLSGLLRQKNAVAVGEIGLDYARGKFSRKRQQEVFSEQLELAHTAGKPVVLHCRDAAAGKAEGDAYGDTLAILRTDWRTELTHSGILHCFSGSLSDAASALDMGFLLGINGTITYPKNEPLREVLKKIGLNHIVLETDCPYLPPQSCRGKRKTRQYPRNFFRGCRNNGRR